MWSCLLASSRPSRSYSEAFFQPPEPEGPTEEELAAQEAEDRAQAEAELRARYGDLTLQVAPDRAQVLLFLGRGPAAADNLPIGVAHEFIAIADGREPTRAVVPGRRDMDADR